MISDVPIIRYDKHRFFHYAVFKPIALAYFSIFLLENLAENCLNVVFHDDHSQNYVFFTISRKKIIEKTKKNFMMVHWSLLPKVNNFMNFHIFG